jgi:uncharacterized protein
VGIPLGPLSFLAMAQTALITGASIGIGMELARLCAGDGHVVILVARGVERLNAVAAECKKRGAADAHVIPTDLAVPNASVALAEELSRRKLDVDILINNAGFGVHGYFWKADAQRNLDLLQVNITALTQLTRLMLPGMIERQRGRIMNLASVAGWVPGPLMATYFASKAYVMSFSLALSDECRGTGVTATCVCPGATATEFFTRARIASAPLATGPMMSAASVARIGYRAMNRGRALVVTGASNTLVAQATRLLPKMLAARVAGKRNRLRETEK